MAAISGAPDDLVPGLNGIQAVLDAVLRIGGTKGAHVDEGTLLLLGRCW